MNGGRGTEREAVRTTIVGGRPPGCGKDVGEVPRGIEVLVKKASVDAGFEKQLLAERAEAAESIGLELTPAEVAMLDAIPQAQLEAIIARTTVEPRLHKVFLGAAAALMIVALGAAVTGTPGCSKGERPDRPPRREVPEKEKELK